MTDTKVLHLNENNFNDTINSGISLVDFWASWCGPCKMIAPVIDTLAEKYTTVSVGKVNVDECMSLAQKYGVMTIPTIIIFKNGEELKRFVGVQKEAVFSGVLDELI